MSTGVLICFRGLLSGWMRLGPQDRAEFGAVVHAELGVGVVQLFVHGADRDGQPAGDVLVGEALGGEPDDRPFPPGQAGRV